MTAAGIRFWIVVVVLALLHFLLHLGFGLDRAAPDLLTVALLVAARRTGIGWGAGLGFAFGLLEDAFSVLAFGTSAVAMTVVGGLAASTRDFFVGESPLFFVVYLLAGKWLRDLVRWTVGGDLVREPFVHEMIVQSGLAALYAAAVGLVALALAGRLREVRT